ncbi:MAG: hypothetical protein ACSW8I_04115 [bacterium]
MQALKKYPGSVCWLISPIVLPLFSHRSPILDGRTMGEQWENDGRNTLPDTYFSPLGCTIIWRHPRYHIKMKNKRLLRLTALMLVACLACTACGSSANMHKHKRSDCDCPTF